MVAFQHGSSLSPPFSFASASPGTESAHCITGWCDANCSSVRFSSVTQSCPTLCDPMNCSTPGLPVHHQLLEFTQTHVHRVSDAIQPSHPLSSPSPPAPNPSQHQSFPMSQVFAWGGQSTGVAALASFLPKKSQGWSPSEWTGWISLQSKGLSRVFSSTTVQLLIGSLISQILSSLTPLLPLSIFRHLTISMRPILTTSLNHMLYAFPQVSLPASTFFSIAQINC